MVSTTMWTNNSRLINNRLDCCGVTVHHHLSYKKPVSAINYKQLKRDCIDIIPDQISELVLKYTSGICIDWMFDQKNPSSDLLHDSMGANVNWRFEDYPTIQKDCHSFVQTVIEPFDPEQEDIWQHCFPFITTLDADCIGIHKTNNKIYFLEHNSDRFIHGMCLADDLFTFLDLWEKLCFIGPEADAFEVCFDAQKNTTSHLSTTGKQLIDWFDKKS